MKKYVLFVLMLLVSICLAACGSSSGENRLETIKNRGQLVVAVSPDYAPFEFKALVDGKDTVVGADILLAQTIADELGVSLELSTMNFDNVLTSLKSGQVDLAISGLSYTEERAKVYDFSEPYYEAENAFLMRREDAEKFQSLDHLDGVKIAVQKGSIEEGLSRKQLSSSHMVSLTAMGEAISELKSGHVQLVTLEKPVAEGYAAQNTDLVIAPFALQTGQADAKVIALPKGNPELKAVLDKVVQTVKKNGSYHQFIRDAWVLTEVAND